MKLHPIAAVVLFACAFTVSLTAKNTLKALPAATSSSTASADFDKIKELSGEWVSRSASDPMLVTRHTYRVVSNGSAVMLTMDVPNEGPMITMFYLDGSRLMTTHFCGAKNQPRFVAANSSNPKEIVFKFKDATNVISPKMGVMSAVTLKLGDADHHAQQWTFTENGKSKTETFELERTK